MKIKVAEQKHNFWAWKEVLRMTLKHWIKNSAPSPPYFCPSFPPLCRQALKRDEQ